MDPDKLIDLQTRSVHHEQTIEQLSDVIFGQTKRIDELEREIKRLAAQIEGLAGAQPLGDPLDEKPPHY